MWEASRFAVASSRGREKALASVTYELFAAMVELGLHHCLTDIVAVVDVRMERILRMAGWPLRRFAPPQPIGVTKAVGGLLDISDASLESICARGRLARPVIDLGQARHAA